MEVLDTLSPNSPIISHPCAFISLNTKESATPVLLYHSGKKNVTFPYEDNESNYLRLEHHNVDEYSPQLNFPLNTYQLIPLSATSTHLLKMEGLS